MELLGSDTMPFGLVRDLEIAIAQPVRMERGDVFAVISDGIFEAPDAVGEILGCDRVAELIRAESSSSPSQILALLRQEVEQHTGGTPPPDDCTVVIIKRAGR